MSVGQSSTEHYFFPSEEELKSELEKKVASQIEDAKKLVTWCNKLGEWKDNRIVFAVGKGYRCTFDRAEEVKIKEILDQRQSTVINPPGLIGVFAKKHIPKGYDNINCIYTHIAHNGLITPSYAYTCVCVCVRMCVC